MASDSLTYFINLEVGIGFQCGTKHITISIDENQILIVLIATPTDGDLLHDHFCLIDNRFGLSRCPGHQVKNMDCCWKRNSVKIVKTELPHLRNDIQLSSLQSRIAIERKPSDIYFSFRAFSWALNPEYFGDKCNRPPYVYTEIAALSNTRKCLIKTLMANIKIRKLISIEELTLLFSLTFDPKSMFWHPNDRRWSTVVCLCTFRYKYEFGWLSPQPNARSRFPIWWCVRENPRCQWCDWQCLAIRLFSVQSFSPSNSCWFFPVQWCERKSKRRFHCRRRFVCHRETNECYTRIQPLADWISYCYKTTGNTTD